MLAGITACAAAGLVPPSAPTPAIELSHDLAERIRSMVGARVPGVAVGWIDAGGLRTVNVGYARNGSAVGDYTIFEAASLSKPVFALGVLALHARGLLDLDEPLSRIVDVRAETDDDRVLAITPRHALTHTSGLPNWRFHASPLRCRFAPGSRFSYSGEGIFLLQRAVEHVTQTGLAAYLASAVLTPLAMHSSSFAYQHRLAHRLAVPHDAAGKPTYHRTARLGEQLLRMAAASGRAPTDWTWPEMRAALPQFDPPQRPLPVFALINAASSLLTTAKDYTRIFGALAKQRSMTEPQVAVTPAISWGLGVGLETGARPVAFHWGDNDGFKAIVEADTGTGRGAVVLTNGDAGIPVGVDAERAIVGPAHPSFAWIEAIYA